MSLATIKLEMLRKTQEDKISQIKALGYQSVPMNDVTERQIMMYLINNIR